MSDHVMEAKPQFTWNLLFYYYGDKFAFTAACPVKLQIAHCSKQQKKKKEAIINACMGSDLVV